MIKTTTWGLTATAAAAVMLSMNAFAQTTPPAGTPPAAAPKATTPAAAPKATTAAPGAAAPATTPAAPAPKKGVVEKAKDAVKGAKEAVVKKVDDTKKAVAAVSACKGLDQAACGAKGAECGWVVPTKIDAKTKKADAPYCRKVAGVAKKAADAKAAAPAAAKAAAPAGAAPAAPKPAATPAAPGATPAPAAPKKP